MMDVGPNLFCCFFFLVSSIVYGSVRLGDPPICICPNGLTKKKGLEWKEEKEKKQDPSLGGFFFFFVHWISHITSLISLYPFFFPIVTTTSILFPLFFNRI